MSFAISNITYSSCKLKDQGNIKKINRISLLVDSILIMGAAAIGVLVLRGILNVGLPIGVSVLGNNLGLCFIGGGIALAIADAIALSIKRCRFTHRQNTERKQVETREAIPHETTPLIASNTSSLEAVEPSSNKVNWKENIVVQREALSERGSLLPIHLHVNLEKFIEGNLNIEELKEEIDAIIKENSGPFVFIVSFSFGKQNMLTNDQKTDLLSVMGDLSKSSGIIQFNVDIDTSSVANWLIDKIKLEIHSLDGKKRLHRHSEDKTESTYKALLNNLPASYDSTLYTRLPTVSKPLFEMPTFLKIVGANGEVQIRVIPKPFRPVRFDDLSPSSLILTEKKEDPWTFFIPDYFPGQKTDLPKELDSYFAYGNCSLDEAELIFMTDSNHAHKELHFRRNKDLFNHILNDGDILIREGCTSQFKEKVKMNGNEITITGFEEVEAHTKALNSEDDIDIIQNRNGLLAKCISENKQDLKEDNKTVVTIGLRHIDEKLMRKFAKNKFLVLYEKEVIIEKESKWGEMEDNCYNKGMAPNFHEVLEQLQKE